MSDRIIEDWDGIQIVFVALEDFGLWDITRIANQGSHGEVLNLTFIWATMTFPMQPARMEKLLALPKSAYAVAWCVPLEVAATLEEFRDWMMPRLRATDAAGGPWSDAVEDLTLEGGVNTMEEPQG